MRRPVLLFALLFALLILGLALLNGALVALGIPLAVYLAVAYASRPAPLPLGVRAVRSLDLTHVAPGQAVTVTLTITNEGEDIAMLTVQDSPAPGLMVSEGETHIITPLPSGAQVMLQYKVSGPRGEYGFQPVRAIASSIGGFEQQAVLAAPATLLIRPPVRPLRLITLRPPRTRGFAGPIPARQSGSGVDFFGLRPYQLGDRLRWMNWRVSARHERSLFSNEFEQERIADVGLILDARAQGDVPAPDGESSLYDHAIEATASLAETLLGQGNRVGVWIYGRGREGVFPGYGRMQRERIFRALGRTAAGHNYALESLQHLPTRFFPAGSQIIFIGPLTGKDDVAVLTRLRAKGYGVLVLSPDPLEFETRGLPASPSLLLARRMGEVERRLALSRLRQVGVQVVDWRTTQPLDEALARQPAYVRRLVST
jgi:uncharacterized protein (DUF58 family)